MNRRELLGTLSAAIALPVLAGRPADQLLTIGRRVHARGRGRGREGGRGSAFQVLDLHQSETVATIAEMIIPATDTPGARAAEVDRFIDLLLAEWADEDERAKFLQGLADIDARARAAFGTDFLTATEAQRVTLLTQLDGEAQQFDPTKPAARPPFFQQLKWVTVFGYCTSEVGASAELHYQAIPGSYEACTELGNWRAAPGDF